VQISKAQSSTMRVESHEVHDTPIVSHQAVQTDERSMETPPFAAAQSQATSSAGQVRGDDLKQTMIPVTAASAVLRIHIV